MHEPITVPFAPNSPSDVGRQPLIDRAIDEGLYFTEDYVALPNFGEDYYSISDAALIAALDVWSKGDDVDFYESDEPSVRELIAPITKSLVAALLQSVMSGELRAEILRRKGLDDPSPFPDRTYIQWENFSQWLRVRGHEDGPYLDNFKEGRLDSPWDCAEVIAAERALFRHPQLASKDSKVLQRKGESVESALRRELNAVSVTLILELESRDLPSSVRSSSTRSDRTLLTIIAALCKKVGIDPAARGAAAQVAGLTADIGASVSDDTVLNVLKSIGPAVEARSK